MKLKKSSRNSHYHSKKNPENIYERILKDWLKELSKKLCIQSSTLIKKQFFRVFFGNFIRNWISYFFLKTFDISCSNLFLKFVQPFLLKLLRGIIRQYTILAETSSAIPLGVTVVTSQGISLEKIFSIAFGKLSVISIYFSRVPWENSLRITITSSTKEMTFSKKFPKS